MTALDPARIGFMRCSWEEPCSQRAHFYDAFETFAGLRSDWGLFSVVSDTETDVAPDTATSAHDAKATAGAAAPLGRWVTRRAQSLRSDPRCKGSKVDNDAALRQTERVLRYEIPAMGLRDGGSRYLTLHKPLSGDPGTQGLLCPMAKRMSPSEEVLAWLVCKNPALFENKYCLELGAGLGLAGLMYAASVERVGGE